MRETFDRDGQTTNRIEVMPYRDDPRYGILVAVTPEVAAREGLPEHGRQTIQASRHYLYKTVAACSLTDVETAQESARLWVSTAQVPEPAERAFVVSAWFPNVNPVSLYSLMPDAQGQLTPDPRVRGYNHQTPQEALNMHLANLQEMVQRGWQPQASRDELNMAIEHIFTHIYPLSPAA